VKPIVKWAGGKSRLLGELVSRVPTQVRTFAEPFAGGAALFFALSEEAEAHRRTMKHAVLADMNSELVACYRAVRDDVDAVIEALRAYRYDRALYYATRDQETHGLPDAERAARLIFLNRTCFNGLWRVNAAGKFNVPFGRYTNPRILDEATLRDASRALARAQILEADFAEATRLLSKGDFVYFDPPYVPVSRTASFTSYASGGFGWDAHVRLADEFRRLHADGASVLLSNADTPEVRALYEDFACYVVRMPRMINSNASKRGDTGELLVASWGAKGLYCDATPAAL
jgi:DNA adenine methylase